MAKHHRKLALRAHLFLLGLYCLLFIAGFLNFSQGTSLFHTGFPARAESGLVMALSLGSLMKAVYELHRL